MTPSVEGKVTPASGDALRAQDAALGRAEHAAALVRFRQVALIGTLIWPTFTLVDWMALRTFGQGASPAAILAPRFVSTLLNVAFTVWLHKGRNITPRQLLIADQIIYGGANISIGLMCLSLGGLSSPYLAGTCLVLTARMFSLPAESALTAALGPAFAGPLTVLTGTFLSASLRPQLLDPRALAIFGLNVAYVATTAAFMIFGNRVIGALRRQLFAERSIGRYRLRKRLGAGGMGEVWAAWHAGLKRDVALKILKPGRDVAASVTRFEREVRATSDLTHPNTVRVFDYGATDDGLIYYAMELLEGEDLGSKVAREGRLPAAQAVHLLHQAARALAEAHARGIVHRDVKPENLFVTAAGGEADFVKVLDFGIARFESAEVDHRLTQADTVVGTPRYMAPEVVSGVSAGAAADVYGLGGVLYFALVGSPPIDAPNTAALYAAIVSKEELPAPPVPGLSDALKAVVARALAKDPARRFAHAGELSEALGKAPEAGKWRPAAAALPRTRAGDDAPPEVPAPEPGRRSPTEETRELPQKSGGVG